MNNLNDLKKGETKEEEKVEFKSNIINQLRLYRACSFSDPLVFLDEDVQNAQRAHATIVEVELDRVNNCISIHNNGDPLTNPGKLFTLAESGWSDDVMRDESPFGLGFLSNISIGNPIKIMSGTYDILMDIDKILASGNPEVECETAPDYKGFNIDILNVNFERFKVQDLVERITVLGQYVEDVQVSYRIIDESPVGDFIVVQKVDQVVKGDGYISIIEPGVKGSLRLIDSYSSKVKVFHRGRIVKTLDSLYGFEGNIHVEASALTLAVPDRKEIIKDDKYYDFLKLMKNYAKRACIEFCDTHQDSDIDKLSWIIVNYLDPQDIPMRQIKIVSSKKDHDYITRLINIKANGYFRGLSDADEELSRVQERIEVSEIVPELGLEDMDVSVLVTDTEFSNRSRSNIESSSSYTVTNKAEKILERATTKPKDYLKSAKLKVWVSFESLPNYSSVLSDLAAYDIDVIIASNSLQTKYLESLSSPSLIPISEIPLLLSVKVDAHKVGLLNKREQRLMMLMDLISAVVGLPNGTFKIGDLKAYKVIVNGDFTTQLGIESDGIIAARDGHIYIERALVRSSYNRQDLNPELSIVDYKFILRNLRSIAKQISRLTTEMHVQLNGQNKLYSAMELEDRILNYLTR